MSTLLDPNLTWVLVIISYAISIIICLLILNYFKKNLHRQIRLQYLLELVFIIFYLLPTIVLALLLRNLGNLFWAAYLIVAFGFLCLILNKISEKTKTIEKVNKKEFYKNLVSRNFGLVPEVTQKKIKRTTILFVGCGLGSQTAVLATRMGFENFILCDGDKAELSNLNRQGFDINDLGKNKAIATAKHIKKINPLARIKVIPKFIKTKKEIKDLVSQSDIVINSADPDEAIYLLNDESQKQGKPVFFPMTFGSGGYLLIFKSNSPTIEKILGGKFFDADFFEKLIMRTVPTMGEIIKANPGFIKIYQEAFEKQGFVPQIGQSVFNVSSMVVTNIIKLLEGKKIVTAPKVILVDPIA